MPVLTPLPLQRHSTAYSPQTHYQYLASESTSFLSACDHAMERRKGGAGARRSSSANPWAAPPATSTPSETRKPKATTAGGSTPHRPGGAASRRPVDALEECLAAANTAGFDAPSVTSREGGAAEVATAYVRAKRELADAKVRLSRPLCRATARSLHWCCHMSLTVTSSIPYIVSVTTVSPPRPVWSCAQVDAAVRERNAMHKEFLSADVARLKVRRARVATGAGPCVTLLGIGVLDGHRGSTARSLPSTGGQAGALGRDAGELSEAQGMMRILFRLSSSNAVIIRLLASSA